MLIGSDEKTVLAVEVAADGAGRRFRSVGQPHQTSADGHGLAPPWTRDTLSLAALVALCLGLVRLCPNSLELPLDRLGRLSQVGLATATAVAVLLMNYGSKFLYFQF